VSCRFFLTPHTPECFAALDEFDPGQAAMIRQALNLVGRLDVCGSCGDEKVVDYRVTPRDLAFHPASTMRLCETCRDLRIAVSRDTLIPLANES